MKSEDLVREYTQLCELFESTTDDLTRKSIARSLCTVREMLERALSKENQKETLCNTVSKVDTQKI